MSTSHVNDPRILDLGNALTPNTGYYLPVEKAGDSDATKKPISDITDQAKTDVIASRGEVVYAARIYETNNGVNNTTNVEQWINNGIIVNIDTVSNRYQFQTNIISSLIDFENTYQVILTPNPSNLDDARIPSYKYLFNTVLVRGELTIALNDSTSSDKLDIFTIEIKKMK